MANNSKGSNWAKIIAAMAVLGIVGKCVNPDPPPAPPKEKEPPKECAKDDLDCRGNKALVFANTLCRRGVEQSATHNFRWVDGTFESKFSYYRWTKKPGERITLIGDKIEFMNAFGAYFPMIYECDLADGDTKAVAIRVAKGRL